MQTQAGDFMAEKNTFPLGLIRFGYNGTNVSIISANEYYYGLFGMTEEEYFSLKPDEQGFQIVFASNVTENIDSMADIIKKEAEPEEEISFYFRARNKNKEAIYIGINARLAEEKDGTFIYDACAYGIDWIVNRLTNYDKLTGLPKIHIFNTVAMSYMNNADEDDKFAVISLDLNNFKLINEKIGAEKGDKVLTELGIELDSAVKNRGCCCRIFSDKYIVFVKYEKEEDIKVNTEKLIEKYTAKRRNEFDNCNFSISVGIYFIENPEQVDITIAIDKANIARKNAKTAQNAQENFCVVYEEEMKTELSRAMQITAEAERAIYNREFIVYYQPKISLKGEYIVGAEALVRWLKPDGTIVPPGMFLPYLERSSFIKEVDFYVYDEVCRFIRNELDNGEKVIPISVNVSRLHLKDDDFISRVSEIVGRYQIPQQYLEFELTENAFFDDEQRAVQILKELRDKGFLVSIDDFGSGYSSLNLLKTLPVDILKLDRTFFGNNDLKENNAIVVTSIIDMANQMKISVICEGVETLEQVEFLKDTECNSVQGFYYAKPIPAEEFQKFKRSFEISESN
ncbi:MAG: GGDEF domain-containing phosphodiesterase [Oscillospiraceae bacterium]|nr:GGDEF domain-containing phosphodiesterase [Oscillospiraceae bacterium]